MPAQRDAKGRFIKGNSAAKNRRTSPEEFRAMARDYGPEALLKIVKIMRGPGKNDEILRAAMAIIERAYGKPQPPEDEQGARDVRVIMQGAEKYSE